MTNSKLPRPSSPSRTRRTLIASVALALGASSAFATIVAVVPDIVLFTPASVVLNATQSNVRIIGFDERQCITLAAPLYTDHAVLPTGSKVSCHFFHGDPVTTLMLSGKARFDTNIVGVISTSTNLDASDIVCRRAGVTYPMPGSEANRGLEALQPNDGYNIIDAGRGIAISMDIPAASDQVRVITCCGAQCN